MEEIEILIRKIILELDIFKHLSKFQIKLY